MPAWIWFVVALVAAGGGALLLLSERSRSSGRSRDRRRWAEQKSWEFVEVDPVLPSRWRYGAVHQGGHGRALDLATGAVPGPGGRRLAHVFDHEQGGQVTSIVAAVRGVATVPSALELRLPSAPLPDDAGLDSMGQVGDRYAFVTSVQDARPLITADVAAAADGVGDDVPLVWAEDTWVLASTDADADPDRMQEILQALVGLSVALEDATDGGGDRGTVEHDAPDAPDAPAGDDRRTTVIGSREPGTDRAAGEDDDEYEDFAEGRDDAPASDDTGGNGSDTDPGPGPTHRDRPADIPYDVEDDGFGPGARSSSGRGR